MKKSKVTNLKVKRLSQVRRPVIKVEVGEFKHIGAEERKLLAAKAGCDESYVFLLLNDKRTVRSVMSRKIIRAARLLNRSIATAHANIERVLIDGID
jgi:hypothetical protein